MTPEKPEKKIIQHISQGRKNVLIMNFRHFDCRIRTIPGPTQTLASDTLMYSTSRFGPFFRRIVGVLTVVEILFVIVH